MKRIMIALLLAASVTATACNGQGGTPAQPAGNGGATAKPSGFGGSYKGKVQRGYEITFDVSPDGTKVTEVAANVLETCMGVSGTRISQLYWDGPFPVSPDGTVTVEGQDPEFPELQFRFTATFGTDGSAAGKVMQSGAGCTTYELEWNAQRN